jgi:hypothetical protein
VSSSRRRRAVLALAVNNWLSRGYLAAVVLTAGFALYEDVFVSHADASRQRSPVGFKDGLSAFQPQFEGLRAGTAWTRTAMRVVLHRNVLRRHGS